MYTKILMRSITMCGVQCNLGYILWVVVIFCLWLQLSFGCHLVIMIQNFVIISDPYRIRYILCANVMFCLSQWFKNQLLYHNIDFLIVCFVYEPFKKPQEHLILHCDLPNMGGGFKNWRVNWAVIVRNCCIIW